MPSNSVNRKNKQSLGKVHNQSIIAFSPTPSAALFNKAKATNKQWNSISVLEVLLTCTWSNYVQDSKCCKKWITWITIKLADITTRSCLEQQWSGKAKHMTQNDSLTSTHSMYWPLIFTAQTSKPSWVALCQCLGTLPARTARFCVVHSLYSTLLVSSDLELTYTFISQLATIKTAWACISWVSEKGGKKHCKNNIS